VLFTVIVVVLQNHLRCGHIFILLLALYGARIAVPSRRKTG